MASLFVVYIPTKATDFANSDTNSQTHSSNEESPVIYQTDDCGNSSTSTIHDGEDSALVVVNETESSSKNECSTASVCHEPEESKAEPSSGEASEKEQLLISNADSCADATQPSRIGQSEHPDFEHQYSTEHISFEQLLQAILESLEIDNDVWAKTDDGECFQVTFMVDTDQTDLALRYLTRHGIGTMENTSVSVFPSDYFRCGDKESEERKSLENIDDFLKSVKSRMTVAKVVEVVKGNAILTFDFIALTILASLIAGMGLAENSSVVLVASMLVAPLMGPIMGGTFGAVIRYHELWSIGLKNEAIGLSICLAIGLLFGFVTSAFNIHGTAWGSTDSWPTAEMYSRGMLRSLWVGVLIAIPSGAGVALSLLGGNTGSLVGVAISASLLPPAVNAGMLWAYAIVSTIIHPDWAETHKPIYDAAYVSQNVSNVTDAPPVLNVSYSSSSGLDCPKLHDNAYEFTYRCNMAAEAAILGAVSLLLTFTNIVCIILMAILVLWIKEVAPHTAKSEYVKNFWKTDIKIARQTYQTMKLGIPQSTSLAQFAQNLSKVKQAEVEIANSVNSVVSAVYDPSKTLSPSVLRNRDSGVSQSPFFGNLFDSHTVHPDERRGKQTTSNLEKMALVENLSAIEREPLKVLLDNDANSSTTHKRARRRYYRQPSCPARYITVDHKRIKKSTGRFLIETVKEEPETTSLPARTEDRSNTRSVAFT